jgi:hypothetical protein
MNMNQVEMFEAHKDQPKPVYDAKYITNNNDSDNLNSIKGILNTDNTSKFKEDYTLDELKQQLNDNTKALDIAKNKQHKLDLNKLDLRLLSLETVIEIVRALELNKE